MQTAFVSSRYIKIEMKTFSIKKETAIHIFFWVIYFLSYFITLSSDNETLFVVNNLDAFSVTFLIATTSVFYLNYIYILKNSFKSHNLGLILFGFLIAFSYFIAVRYLLEEVVVFYLYGYRNYFEGTSLLYYIFDNLHWGATPIFVSSAIWIILNFIRTLQSQVHITEEKRKAEIQFLKGQINPHFIFNTLNNIYSLIVSKSDLALSGIEKLSEIMRFTSYQTQKELINLSEEINYCKSLIDLETIRTLKPIQIQLYLDLENNNQQVPPYFLFPFFENCIKHGILTDLEKPALIAVTCRDKKWTILSENQCNDSLKDEHSGIGFENLRKRLDYYYPKKYEWTVTNESNFFRSLLIIQL
jgi:sensor histidine kinase YesM